VQQASDSGGCNGGYHAHGTPLSPPTGPPVHAPFWNEPMVRDYIKHASQHGMKRRDPPSAGGSNTAVGEHGCTAGGSKAQSEGDGQRRAYARVMSAPAGAAAPTDRAADGAAAPRAAAAYDPDVAPRIRTVKMLGPQHRTSQDGPLRR
jgi:hypothetical protein